MSAISYPFSFIAGATIIATQFNSNFTEISNIVNGNLDQTNLTTLTGLVSWSVTANVLAQNINSSSTSGIGSWSSTGVLTATKAILYVTSSAGQISGQAGLFVEFTSSSSTIPVVYAANAGTGALYAGKSTSSGDLIRIDDGSGNALFQVTQNGQVSSIKFDSKEISNLSLSCALSSHALTISLKTKAGSTATSSDPVSFAFRNATAATGQPNRRQVTGALSTTISSGSTAGHTSGQNRYLFIYAIDNAGSVELAWSSRMFDEGTVHSTTAEGGAGAADDGYTLYSTTARSNVPIRLIGRLLSNQTAAGTWDALPVEISVGSFQSPVPRSEVWVRTANAFGAAATKIRRWTTTQKNVGTAITYADDASAGGSFTINEYGNYGIEYSDQFAAGSDTFGISVNSSQLSTAIQSITAADRRIFKQTPGADFRDTLYVALELFPGDVVRAHVGGTGSGGNIDCEMFRIVKLSE